ncbi:MAG TPA: hypothetical protein V6D12_24985 [Candidatus Obscuribacterales bacterium]
MSALNRSSQRRLNNLQQIPSVWEGDRRPLSGLADSSDLDGEANGECIIWVDGVEGVVRAMEVVAAEIGPEAIVRTLLRAMEHPHSPSQPARPQKIVVRDREIQFYLRGVLQDLDITIDYAPELPLIDELFRGFAQMANGRQPKLPPQYADLILEKAYDIWQQAPWEVLADHQIISVEINHWDVGTLYASVMGMLGMEYGILLYRSLDSLKRFRATVLADDSFEQMEEAFLGQDCFFVTFERSDDYDDDDDDDEDFDLADLPVSEIEPNFGTIHPLEGMRPFLYEEEAIAVYVAISALHKFINANQRQLEADTLPALNKNFRITLPPGSDEKQNISVKVATLPEFEAELLEMIRSAEEEEEVDTDDVSLPLRDDLVPKDSFLSLGMMPWDKLESLRSSVEYHQAQDVIESGEGLPVILIQTTRPKAKAMIEKIETAGGLRGICFNPGEDPMEGEEYDLGILQTEDGSLYLFGEFMDDDPVHAAARKKWDQRSKKTKGHCGLIIAKGLTGASRGNPQLGDMMALFETRSLSAKELGLGLLQLMPQFDFE